MHLNPSLTVKAAAVRPGQTARIGDSFIHVKSVTLAEDGVKIGGPGIHHPEGRQRIFDLEPDDTVEVIADPEVAKEILQVIKDALTGHEKIKVASRADGLKITILDWEMTLS